MIGSTSLRASMFGGLRTAAASRALSTSAVRNDLARMQVLGRLAADPELKSTKNGKDYVRYTVATSDPSRTVGENGEPEQTTSYLRIYVFGERGVERMKSIKKGYRVLVDADFRIERTPSPDGQSPARESLLAIHRAIQVIAKPQNASE
ncbi:ssDNA-binding protein, mitochondrial [Thecaphora frezii]